MLKLASLFGLIASTAAGVYFLFCLALVYSHINLRGAREQATYFSLLSLAAGVVWVGCLVVLLREFIVARRSRHATARGN